MICYRFTGLIGKLVEFFHARGFFVIEFNTKELLPGWTVQGI